MPTISLCMIVKNEEQFLEKCLQSVQGLVDEIVIVDTGSTDKTPEIAKKFTQKVFNFQWCDDFSAARNESLKHATGDWILVLDADETISRQDLKQLLLFADNNQFDVYSFITRSYINNSHDLFFVSSQGDTYEESKPFLGWIPHRIARFFKNHHGLFYNGRVHELIEYSAYSCNKAIEETNIPIHHYGLLRGEEINKRKEGMYKHLGILKAQDTPGDIKASFELGKILVNEGDYHGARKLFEHIISLDPSFPQIYTLLVYVYAMLGLFELSDEAYVLSQGHHEDPTSSSTNKAISLEKRKKYQEAIGLLIKCNLDKSDYFPALYVLGRCSFFLKDYPEAVFYLEKALLLHPGHFKCYEFLIQSYLCLGNKQKCLEILNLAIKINHPLSKELKQLVDGSSFESV